MGDHEIKDQLLELLKDTEGQPNIPGIRRKLEIKIDGLILKALLQEMNARGHIDCELPSNIEENKKMSNVDKEVFKKFTINPAGAKFLKEGGYALELSNLRLKRVMDKEDERKVLKKEQVSNRRERNKAIAVYISTAMAVISMLISLYLVIRFGIGSGAT